MVHRYNPRRSPRGAYEVDRAADDPGNLESRRAMVQEIAGQGRTRPKFRQVIHQPLRAEELVEISSG